MKLADVLLPHVTSPAYYRAAMASSAGAVADRPVMKLISIERHRAIVLDDRYLKHACTQPDAQPMSWHA